MVSPTAFCHHLLIAALCVFRFLRRCRRTVRTSAGNKNQTHQHYKQTGPILFPLFHLFHHTFLLALLLIICINASPKHSAKNIIKTILFLHFFIFFPLLSANINHLLQIYFIIYAHKKSTVHTLYDGFYAVPIPQ